MLLQVLRRGRQHCLSVSSQLFILMIPLHHFSLKTEFRYGLRTLRAFKLWQGSRALHQLDIGFPGA